MRRWDEKNKKIKIIKLENEMIKKWEYERTSK